MYTTCNKALYKTGGGGGGGGGGRRIELFKSYVAKHCVWLIHSEPEEMSIHPFLLLSKQSEDGNQIETEGVYWWCIYKKGLC